jgi:hypothetical protein
MPMWGRAPSPVPPSEARRPRRNLHLQESPGTLSRDSVSNRIDRSLHKPSEPVKKAFLTVAAVVGYSLVETGLLLSTFGSHQGYYYPTTYQSTLYFGQLLLIPGLGALLSRIMYGPHRWRTRTLPILLAGILALPFGITALAIVIVPLAWAFDTSRTLFYLLLPVSLVGAVFGLFVAKQKSEKWGVRAEAARWLAERQ